MRNRLLITVAFVLACSALAAGTAVRDGGAASGPPQKIAALVRHGPTLPVPSKPGAYSRIAHDDYSFCGACTQDDDCGSGNRCCTGDCTDGKKKCYAVSTCGE